MELGVQYTVQEIVKLERTASELRPGVYQIRCLANEMLYCGSSFDILTRWKRHIHLLGLGCHENKRLRMDYIAHGPHNFKFSILAFAENALDALQKERPLILEMKAAGNCYNRYVPCKPKAHVNHRPSGMSPSAFIAIAVERYGTDWEYDMARATGYSVSTINGIRQGKHVSIRLAQLVRGLPRIRKTQRATP